MKILTFQNGAINKVYSESKEQLGLLSPADRIRGRPGSIYIMQSQRGGIGYSDLLHKLNKMLMMRRVDACHH